MNRKSVKIHSCWPTPIYIRSRPDTNIINAQLTGIILDLSSASPEPLSNVGSLRTNSDLLRISHPAIGTLTNWILEAILTLHEAITLNLPTPTLDDIVAEAWGNVYYAGDYQMPHIHHDSIWSGVYYVAIPTSDPNCTKGTGGVLELYDPRIGAYTHSSIKASHYNIEPQEGMLVAFPSWLVHGITPHLINKPRISIAFNAGVPRDGEHHQFGDFIP